MSNSGNVVAIYVGQKMPTNAFKKNNQLRRELNKCVFSRKEEEDEHLVCICEAFPNSLLENIAS